MSIDKDLGKKILCEQAAKATRETTSREWERKFEDFSRICEDPSRQAKTHIAFLGITLLAKATWIDVDVFGVKAGDSNPGAYSARSFGHEVFVKHALKLGIHLGTTGREPLNNQPYFRIDRLSRDITIKESSRPALNALCDICDYVAKIRSREEILLLLRTYIYVRRNHMPKYGAIVRAEQITTERFIQAVAEVVSADSESGKRAQSVAAGLMDVFVGDERVETQRVNDPDRHFPGDVGVTSASDETRWEKVFEVRDKVVDESDLYLFAQKVAKSKIGDAAVLAVATRQGAFPVEKSRSFAASQGVSLTVFFGWESFIRQVVFWCETPQTEAIQAAVNAVYERICALEVSRQGADLWLRAVSQCR